MLVPKQVELHCMMAERCIVVKEALGWLIRKGVFSNQVGLSSTPGADQGPESVGSTESKRTKTLSCCNLDHIMLPAQVMLSMVRDCNCPSAYRTGTFEAAKERVALLPVARHSGQEAHVEMSVIRSSSWSPIIGPFQRTM